MPTWEYASAEIASRKSIPVTETEGVKLLIDYIDHLEAELKHAQGIIDEYYALDPADLGIFYEDEEDDGLDEWEVTGAGDQN